jgi:hypothetical protein
MAKSWGRLKSVSLPHLSRELDEESLVSSHACGQVATTQAFFLLGGISIGVRWFMGVEVGINIVIITQMYQVFAILLLIHSVLTCSSVTCSISHVKSKPWPVSGDARHEAVCVW